MNVLKKLRTFFVLLVVLLLVSFPLSSDAYYITEEQLMELQNQSNQQKALIENQKEMLKELDNQLMIQDNQLYKLEIQTENLENQLNQAETSLKKSKSKSWIEKVLIGIATFFIGAFTGGLFIYNHAI